jgi:hypothetical protein
VLQGQTIKAYKMLSKNPEGKIFVGRLRFDGMIIVKLTLSLQQAVEAHRVVRHRGSHIF